MMFKELLEDQLISSMNLAYAYALRRRKVFFRNPKILNINKITQKYI